MPRFTLKQFMLAIGVLALFLGSLRFAGPVSARMMFYALLALLATSVLLALGSGGYYISMGAKKIFAEPGTLTGSIGVVSGKFALKGLFDKVGVTTETISRGKTAGTFSMTDPFTAAEREALKAMSLEIYEQFTTKAAAGRHMELEKLKGLAEGRLYSGRMALEVGLVDQIGTLDEAVAAAKTAGGLEADAEVDYLILPEQKGIFEQLLGGSESEAEVRAALPAQLRGADLRAALPPQLREAITAAGALEALLNHPVATAMPFRVEFK